MTKKILFCWIHQLESYSGGVERLTLRLIEGLNNRGHNCFFIHFNEKTNSFYFNNNVVLDIDDFLINNNFDIFINQNGQSDNIAIFFKNRKWKGSLFICHHVEPFYLRKIFDFRHILNKVFSYNNTLSYKISWLIRLIIYPLWSRYSLYKISKTQLNNYTIADKYIILSYSFQNEFCKLLGLHDLKKLVAIPNPLSYDNIFYNNVMYDNKKLEILIVSRLSDDQKRISAALDIWKNIQDFDTNGWILKIVGDGPDAIFLKNKARQLGLHNVYFLGRCEPLPHYLSASIYLMTSKVEGWGISLTEAMQFGVVPIAFDSYSSLRDIINDGLNGIIIENNNNKLFSYELLNLMNNHDKRKNLSYNATISISKYSLSNIIDNWEFLIK